MARRDEYRVWRDGDAESYRFETEREAFEAAQEQADATGKVFAVDHPSYPDSIPVAPHWFYGPGYRL